MSRRAFAVAGAAVLAFGMTGCAATYEGSGSKDAASAEQLAMTTDDPWDAAIVQTRTSAEGNLIDGTYTGTGMDMGGPISVTLTVKGNVITVDRMVQTAETQSVGGFEAIRDGKYAEMIEAAQGSDIDTISGATVTTVGVRSAVDDALAQAAGAESTTKTEEAK